MATDAPTYSNRCSTSSSAAMTEAASPAEDASNCSISSSASATAPATESQTSPVCDGLGRLEGEIQLFLLEFVADVYEC